MQTQKEKLLIVAFLLVSIASFFSFGLYHLAKFETADEHLWKYGRIKQYWQAVKNQDWDKTYINDKPGVTVALISGIGLLFEPNPETHKITDPSMTKNGMFEIFDSNRTERINYAFRLPILIFSTLSLLLFFWLGRKIFQSDWTALIATMLIALNPILVGMAQIINPDSFLWIFGGLSIFSFLAYLEKNEKKFFWLTAVFTGFALLSKYTAVGLFLFYLLALFSKIVFGDETKSLIWIGKRFLEILLIFLISVFIFSVFLPAVILNPQYLLKGISQFINSKNILAFAGFFGLLFLAASIWKNSCDSAVVFLRRNQKFFLAAASAVFLLVTVLVFLNVWTGQKIVPFDLLKDTAYAQEPKEFNFGQLLKYDNFLEKKAKLYLMEAYPFVFSLSPLMLILIGLAAWKALSGKISGMAATLFFSIISFSILYFSLAIFSRVVTNIRYSILLYPLFVLLGAAVAVEIAPFFKKISRNKIFIGLAGIILLLGTLTLFSFKPFYFSYANFLLPKKFSIHTSWGHGAYEAAEYINSFPHPENIIVRSNLNSVCQFIKGKCLKSRKVNLDVIQPDFFVVSKRGIIKERNKFILSNAENGKDADYYHRKLENNYDWAIFIDGRPENYIKVLKFEK